MKEAIANVEEAIVNDVCVLGGGAPENLAYLSLFCGSLIVGFSRANPTSRFLKSLAALDPKRARVG